MDKRQEILDTLSQCVIKLDGMCRNRPFENVDMKLILSIMDNAVFHMNAEIRGIDTQWKLVDNKQIMRDINLDRLLGT